MIHKKNEEYEIKITDIGTEGEGIGHLDDGYTLFVQGALPGDTVRVHLIKAQKKYGIAKPVAVIEPSPDRIVPACPLADRCGGCQISALSYEAQLHYKERKVRELLVRVGGFPESKIDSVFEGIIGYYDEEPKRYSLRECSGNAASDTRPPVRFRNKAQYPVGTSADGHIVTGFYAPHSHRIIPCTDCLIGASTDAPILEAVRAFMDEYGVTAYDETTGQGLVRHILIRTGYETGEIQVCLVINGEDIPHSDILTAGICKSVTGTHIAETSGSDTYDLHAAADMVRDDEADPGRFSAADPERRVVSICTSTNIDDTNVILGDNYKVIYGQGYITDKIGDLSFHISPLSFYQVNPVQTRKLYGKALEYAGLTGTETVWDLYCGIGTISLFLAQAAGRVYGIEVVPQAIDDARENAQLNGIDNAEFMTGKAEEVLPEFHDSHSDSPNSAATPDVIVVDPPRKGCDAACLDTMLKMKPDRIVYVSCDPATLARDLKTLCADGSYELTRISCTDMFSNSVHVENVVLLTKQNT